MSRCFQQGSVHLRSCKDGQPPPRRAAPRRVLRVRASGDAPQEEKPPVKETTAQRATRRLVKRTYDAESARKVLKKLNDLGVTQPEQLKRVFLQSGVSKLLPRAVSVALNLGACFTAFYAYGLVQNDPDLGVFQRLLESVFFAVGLNYALGTLTEAATLLSVLASALLFQANVDTFLLSMNAAAGPLPKRSGLGTLDSVNELASAVKVASTLNEIRELLRTQSLGGGGGGEGGGVGEPLSARQTYLNLAGLLTVANSASAKRYDASEWSLTEADSMRLAKIFAKYEDESEKLDVGRLRALAAEVGQPFDDAEAALAMRFLDENNDGMVDFSEFVSFLQASRALRKPADPAPKPDST